LYSNSNYFLLAQIVQRVSGMSLPAFTQERIFGPLGMHHTMFRDDTSVVIANRASGYRKGLDGEWHVAEYTYNSLGPGGVVTTVDDLAIWANTFFANRLQPADLPERLQRTRPLTDGGANPYAFGMQVDRYRGLRAIAHAGGMPGFAADLVHFPDHGVSVMCLANSSAVGSGQRTRRIADLWLADAFDDAPTGRPTASRATGQARDEVSVDIDACTGTFLARDETAVYRIASEDGEMTLRAMGQRIALAPAGATTLQTPVGSTLNFDADGFVLRPPGADSPGARFERLRSEHVAGSVDDYAGRFRSAELGEDIDVRAVGDGLQATMPGADAKKLESVSRDLFVAGELPMETVVRFLRDEIGAVIAIQISADRALRVRFDKAN
jgi:hypothetical protein